MFCSKIGEAMTKTEFHFKGENYAVDQEPHTFNYVELPGGVTLKLAWDKNNLSPSEFLPIDPNFQEGYEPPKAYVIEKD